MTKLIITAAICGAEVMKEHNPYVPYTIDEIILEAQSAYEAGASVIHLHVREDDGSPTQAIERYRLVVDGIKKVCLDVIIQPSTGGAVGMSREERLQPLALQPEMVTLDCGSVNFGGDEVDKGAYVEVKMFKTTTRELKSAVNDGICDLLKRSLAISPDNVYITFFEQPEWGFRGRLI